ncbi:CarD family transcriptional regulator [Clostridium tertium]|uniref:CarD family transcriptional regulator n=1 Tax=Clostridium tertium TaxID=1559 RepID=UPI001C1E8C3D|nr:CarD family transcriptional regulator [Clostridium tertium]MBU6135497.1 CarD family transcriptional regulator [Clostridium tertium]
MFKKGDLILYSVHGICKVDDICEKTISHIKKQYYILHPINETNLSISTPVDNDKVAMLELLTKEEAQETLELFKNPGINWIEIDRERSEVYNEIIKQWNRREIVKIANTLMRTKIDLEKNGKKFHEKDKKILLDIQSILFSELAFSLDTTSEEIAKTVNRYVK